MRKFIAKLFTFFIFPNTKRRNARRFLMYFSLKDYFLYRNLKYKVIPIGTFCFPRWIATKIKIKAPRHYGEKTLPFDLSFHNNIDEIILNIENDFKNYFEGLEWSVEENTWINKRLKATYNHDYKLNKKEFIARYKKRIKNFIEYCNSPYPVYFLLFAIFQQNENKEFIPKLEKLNKILLKKRKDKKYKLVFVNMGSEIILDKNIENVEIINQKWVFGAEWGKEIAETDYGKNFYNIITSKLLEIIK